MAVSGAGSTSNLLSSQRMNMTGLATGMNTEEIIQGMTVGTRSKIAKVKQQQTLLNWQADAFRNITDKLISLSTKYTSYLSPATNLMSSKLFAKSVVAAQGANASKVSVTGAGHDNISIAGVQQLAKNASMTTAGNASIGAVTIDNIDLTKENHISLIEGGNLKIKYGNTEYDLTLDSSKKYGTAEEIKDSLNAILAETNFSADRNLGEMIEFTVDGDNNITLANKSSDQTGNSVKITGGSDAVIKGLGLEKINNEDGYSLTGKIEADNIVEKKTGAEELEGKSITFMLDGVRKTFTFEKGKTDTVEKIASSLQEQMNAAYGAGRITVGNDGTGLSFSTSEPTSNLKITEASKGVSGTTGILGDVVGKSNRINLNGKISEVGFNGVKLEDMKKDWLTNEKGEYIDKDGKVLEDQNDEAGRVTTYKFEINGKSIKGITDETTVQELMDAINNSDAGVKVSYMAMADRFSLTSTVDGSAGKIEIKSTVGDDGKTNLAAALFGAKEGNDVVTGQDAILSIKYKGSDEVFNITRASNNIDLDGMSVTLKDTFGAYTTTTENGKDVHTLDAGSAEAITFTASADVDKLVDAVKDLIKDYNEMLDAVNEQVGTKPARDSSSNKVYQPLTDEQRENMSDKEIERWETEAKKGILYNDSTLRTLMSDFRFMVGSEGAEFGIKTSSKYNDNGKLEFDEEAFRKAVAEDPQKVQDFFTKAPVGDEKGGLMYRMKDTLDKYAKTEGASKGILVNKAGHANSPLSLLQNAMKTQQDILDKNLLRLQATLQTQTDRYYKQFTSLETFIQKMNIQSGYLMQQAGLE